VDELLAKVLAAGAGITHFEVTEQDLVMCCRAVKAVFAAEPTLLELNPPITICGDIEGHYTDLVRIFHETGFPPDSIYLFLGNYVNGGSMCNYQMEDIETITLLFCYKIKYPESFFMLRGNFETQFNNGFYGFRDECTKRYMSTLLWHDFNDVFSWMPMAATVGSRLLCVHGGLSPRLSSLDQLRNLPRPLRVPFPSLCADLLISDPNASIKGWQMNPMGGSCYIFGEDVVIRACQTLGVSQIVRGHQVVQDGYE
ncbi:hypothetical protein PMAYCL1PPCAC_22138, partial [Pristionchus mayeri]